MVSNRGYSGDEVAAWSRYALDSDVPFARAISSGEAVWATSVEDMAQFALGEKDLDVGWVSLPLRTAAGVRGALHLSFRAARQPTEAERRWRLDPG